jgi:hypothetical protein
MILGITNAHLLRISRKDTLEECSHSTNSLYIPTRDTNFESNVVSKVRLGAESPQELASRSALESSEYCFRDL